MAEGDSAVAKSVKEADEDCRSGKGWRILGGAHTEGELVAFSD